MRYFNAPNTLTATYFGDCAGSTGHSANCRSAPAAAGTEAARTVPGGLQQRKSLQDGAADAANASTTLNSAGEDGGRALAETLRPNSTLDLGEGGGRALAQPSLAVVVFIIIFVLPFIVAVHLVEVRNLFGRVARLREPEESSGRGRGRDEGERKGEGETDPECERVTEGNRRIVTKRDREGGREEGRKGGKASAPFRSLNIKCFLSLTQSQS
jgi:hypothetical protein